MTKRLCLFAYLWIIGLCCMELAVAAPVKILNVRIWGTPNNTRVVFDTSAPAHYQIIKLSDPYRVVIDFKQAIAGNISAQPDPADKYLKQLRNAKRGKQDLRVVLYLKKFAEAKSFTLPPNKNYGNRMVVDLFNAGATAPPVKAKPVNSMRDIIITLDAGHGGKDQGARGARGTLEKDVVLKITKELAKLINKQIGMRAVLTREGDYFISLANRIKKAREQHKSDLFISIHADAFKDPKVSGSSVYILSEQASSKAAKWLAEQENASDLIGGVKLEDKGTVLSSVLVDLSQAASLEASVDAAKHILRQLQKIGKVHNKGVQAAGFAVLRAPDIPSVLVETAFISNPAEEKKLRNAGHLSRIAKAILKGIRNYFKDFAPPDTLLAAKTKRHVISRGETLSTIAEHYRISTRDLKAYNGLRGDLIRVGQVLNIPVSGDS